MSDIVDELKEADRYNAAHYTRDPLHAKAADEIERLRAALMKVRHEIILGRHKGTARVGLQRATNPIIDSALRPTRADIKQETCV